MQSLFTVNFLRDVFSPLFCTAFFLLLSPELEHLPFTDLSMPAQLELEPSKLQLVPIQLLFQP